MAFAPSTGPFTARRAVLTVTTLSLAIVATNVAGGGSRAYAWHPGVDRRRPWQTVRAIIRRLYAQGACMECGSVVGAVGVWWWW